MRKLYLFLLLLQASSCLFAQQIGIKRVEIAGRNIVVHYDLDDSNPNHLYHIQLFSSQNNFSTALTRVTGDVGGDIKPGTDKQIVWHIGEELGPYKGRISLEIRGRVYVPLLRLTNFNARKKYKRGKSYVFTWQPGNQNLVNLALYKGDQQLFADVVPNNGRYELTFPAKAKPGKDYTIRFIDSRDNQLSVETPQFSVTQKIPLYIKALPLAAGAAVYLLLPKPKETGIPDPELPSGN